MIYGILLAIGVLIFFFGFKKLKESLHLIKTGQQATATVVEMISYRDGDGDVLYKPIFEFTTVTNQKITYRHDIGSRPASWSVGDITGVFYPIDNPEQAKITTYFGLFGWSIVLFCIAAPLLIIGGGYFWALKFL